MNQGNNLQIDNVVASQPELGPTAPDGGYGWVILLSSIFTQITIPSVTIAYGILIYSINYQETVDEENVTFSLWDHKIVIVPVLITVFSIITSSWSRIIVRISNRPRFVAISGVCLVTAGIMISSVGINYDDQEIFFYVFAGIMAGFGTSLTLQQSETLLTHYFSTRLHMVQSAYKVSVLFGNIFIPLIIGVLLSKYDMSTALLIYSAIVWLNCLVLLTYSRPTYIIAPLQKNYKMLKEANEDEDEEIYSTQNEPNREQSVTVEVNEQPTGHKNQALFNDDEQDEEVISTFNAENTKKQVIQPSAQAISRLETSNTARTSRFESDTFVSGHTYHQPESLYRETTVTNGETQHMDNIFAFETPPANTRSAKNTETVKKNMIILISVLLDIKFYIHTYNNFCSKLSMLILCLVYPAFVFEQLPHLDIFSLVGLLMIVFIGGMCFNIVLAFLPSTYNRRLFLCGFNALAIIGLYAIAESDSKTFIIVSGIIASFSIYAMYVIQRNIYEEMKLERGKTITSMASNSITAMLILLIVMIHDYPYVTCFKVAAVFHMANPVPLLLIRKLK